MPDDAQPRPSGEQAATDRPPHADGLAVLVIGSGGREHAIADAVGRSARVARVLVAPGNGGTPGDRFDVAPDDSDGIVALCRRERVDLVIVGPEAALAAGVVDALAGAGIRAFGPTADLARLETSKAHARNIATRLGIPQPRHATFGPGRAGDAIAWARATGGAVVVKQSGLAAGKGVTLPAGDEEVARAITGALAHGDIVVEERLAGPEYSLIAFCDGRTARALPLAQDHKRAHDGDQGPNTGGMGAYAPANPDADVDALCRTFITPVVEDAAASGTPYVGMLYAGLMWTGDGPRLLEWNCRFGDPEAQVLLSLLDVDLVDLVEACLAGTLATAPLRVRPGSSVGVVVASPGYPGEVPASARGAEVTISDPLPEGVTVLHGATRREGGRITAAGGRVVTVVGTGPDLASARTRAYAGVARVGMAGAQFRRDIGWRAAGLSVTSYASTGVDIAEGNRAVALLAASVATTTNDRVLRGVGAFGGAIDASFLKAFDHPVLVASTDGVGTKVELATRLGRVRGTGIDIVNHCVNDVLVQGARPLFFLDYLAASRLDAMRVAEVVDGMAEACRASGCVLLGGETAEMPGVYAPGAFDIAGTLVGVVERSDLLPRPTIAAGDVLVGIASSGPHTNGYSLLRRAFAWASLEERYGDLGRPLADALLEPHRSYLPVLGPLLSDPRLKALAHVTGGGLVENVPRVLPAGLGAVVHRGSWPVPALFRLVSELVSMDATELHRSLNMGIGMVLVVAPEDVSAIGEALGEPSWVIGEVCATDGHGPRVRLVDGFPIASTIRPA